MPHGKFNNSTNVKMKIVHDFLLMPLKYGLFEFEKGKFEILINRAYVKTS